MAIAPLIARSITGYAISKALGRDEQDEKDAEAERPVSTNVKSSVIASISWKDDVITVNFHRGGTYTYPGSRDVYEDFISAPSVGAYFNANIR
jgi:hypothetical protein